MELVIKITSKKNDEDINKGILRFDTGQEIHFSITKQALNEIHNTQVLRNTQTTTGENIYQSTFESKIEL